MIVDEKIVYDWVVEWIINENKCCFSNRYVVSGYGFVGVVIGVMYFE